MKESSCRVSLPDLPESNALLFLSVVRRTRCPSCHFLSSLPKKKTSFSLAPPAAVRAETEGDIDGLPERFDCRLWSSQPGLRRCLCTALESQYRWTRQQFSLRSAALRGRCRGILLPAPALFTPPVNVPQSWDSRDSSRKDSLFVGSCLKTWRNPEVNKRNCSSKRAGERRTVGIKMKGQAFLDLLPC